jgi:hypothetical protein
VRTSARTLGGASLGFVLGAVATAAPTTVFLIALMLEDGDPLRDSPVLGWLGTVLVFLLPPIAGYWPARRYGLPGYLGALAGCVAGMVAAVALPGLLLEVTGTPSQSASFAGMAAWYGGGGGCLSIVFVVGIVVLVRRKVARTPVEAGRW